MQQNYLLISATGPDRTGLVDELGKVIQDNGCNIQESRMTVLGTEFAILVLISGNWNTLAKLEDHLPATGERLGLRISAERTGEPPPTGNLLPYAVEVVALDQPGIVHELGHFFANREINIRDMSTSSYHAAHSGTRMFAIHINIDVPSSTRIAALREEFMDLCDQLNLDAVLEPAKA